MNSAFIATYTRPRHQRLRTTRWATNQCSRPSINTAPRSTGSRTASSECSRASSPAPPPVRHRSPPRSPSAGTGSPARLARSTIARASASVRTTRPSVGRVPGDPQGSPFSIVIGSRSLGLIVVHPGADDRRRRDQSPEAVVGGLVRTAPRVRVGSGGADLAEQSDELLHVPDEVATRQVLVLEYTVEIAARGPRMGDRDEPGVRDARLREGRVVLVDIQLARQLLDRGVAMPNLFRREPRRGRGRRAAVL